MLILLVIKEEYHRMFICAVTAEKCSKYIEIYIYLLNTGWDDNFLVTRYYIIDRCKMDGAKLQYYGRMNLDTWRVFARRHFHNISLDVKILPGCLKRYRYSELLPYPVYCVIRRRNKSRLHELYLFRRNFVAHFQFATISRATKNENARWIQ